MRYHAVLTLSVKNFSAFYSPTIEIMYLKSSIEFLNFLSSISMALSMSL